MLIKDITAVITDAKKGIKLASKRIVTNQRNRTASRPVPVTFNEAVKELALDTYARVKAAKSVLTNEDQVHFINMVNKRAEERIEDYDTYPEEETDGLDSDQEERIINDAEARRMASCAD